MKDSIFLGHLQHAYKHTNGSYTFPNSYEGDLLKQAKIEIKELMATIKRVSELEPHIPVSMGTGNPTNGWKFPPERFLLVSDVKAALEDK